MEIRIRSMRHADTRPTADRTLTHVRKALAGRDQVSPGELSDAVSAYVRKAKASGQRCDQVITRLKQELAAQSLAAEDRRSRRILLTAVVTWCLEEYCSDR